jgi:hypothetical protein
MTYVWQWNTSLERNRRFYHRLQVWQAFGEITEFRRTFKERRVPGKSGEGEGRDEKNCP